MSVSGSFAALERDGYAGRRLGRFEVLCKLGAGGMSEVFLAWQKGVGGFSRPVVLKQILESVRQNQDFLRMFVKEAKITSALSHGGIAHLYELSHEQGELFMVMEFVPGATLVEIAKACHLAREPIPIGLTLAVVADTARALHYAHTFVDPSGRPKSIIHRDVAEKNIMVAFDGGTKLLDFGIARQTGGSPLTQVGTVKGTAGYMSPEQVRGDTLDGRTDVFSLGVVMHECLTGQRLFRRGSISEEIKALLEAPIPAPSQRNREVTISLDSVVMKALSRDRDHRFATAKEMAEAVERAGGALLWEAHKRAAFMQRHFARRQSDITSMLGDPSATNLDELLPESSRRSTRDELQTVNARRLSDPAPLVAEERTIEVFAAGKARSGSDTAPSVNRRTVPEVPVPPGAPVGPIPRRVPGAPYGPQEDKTVTGRSSPDEEDVGFARTVNSRVPVPLDQGQGATTDNPRPVSGARAPPGPDLPITGEEPAAEPRTVIDSASMTSDLDESEELAPEPRTVSAPSKPVAAPPRRGSKAGLAAQQQALLMWIAIGSGLVLGLVLAAFLIFG